MNMREDFEMVLATAHKYGGTEACPALSMLNSMFVITLGEVSDLHSQVLRQSGQITHLKNQIASLKASLSNNDHQIANLIHELHCAKSEKSHAKSRKPNKESEDDNAQSSGIALGPFKS